MNTDAGRGMVKYAPYQSLVEQSTILAKMRYEKGKQPKPRIANERAEEINEILVHYSYEPITAKYWEDGYLYKLDGTIERIDTANRYIQIKGKRIQFRNLINLERA